jgi:hypothetical protein
VGTPPALGRGFTPDDVRPGAPDVVVLSHGIWRARFGGDRAAVGRVLERLPWLEEQALPRFFAVPNPRRRELERLPYDLYAAELEEQHP